MILHLANAGCFILKKMQPFTVLYRYIDERTFRKAVTV